MEKFDEGRVFTGLKDLLLNYLLITKGKNSNFTVEKPGRYLLNQMMQVNVTNPGTDIILAPDTMH